MTLESKIKRPLQVLAFYSALAMASTVVAPTIAEGQSKPTPTDTRPNPSREPALNPALNDPQLNRPGSIIIRRSQAVAQRIRTNGISALALGEQLAGGSIDYNVVKNVRNVGQEIAKHEAEGTRAFPDHYVKFTKDPTKSHQELSRLLSFNIAPARPITPETPPDLTFLRFTRAWEYTKGKDGNNNPVVVGVLDTGITPHPDLNPNILAARDFTDSTTGTLDIYQHGTMVSGAIAARINTEGKNSGGAPDSNLVIGKVVADNGDAYVSWLINGMDYLRRDPRVKIMSMSLAYAYECDPAMQDAVNLAVADGKLIFAATGNNGEQRILSPANCNGVKPVGSIEINNSVSNFSNVNPDTVFAVGTGIRSTNTFENYNVGSGTSLAAPRVAALAALIWASDPSYKAEDVWRKMESGLVPTLDNVGRGHIDAYTSVYNSLPPGPCRPRPRVALSTIKEIDGENVSLKIILTSGKGDFHNVIEGFPYKITSGNAIINYIPENPPSNNRLVFKLRQRSSSQAATAQIEVADDCGTWKTLAGGGPQVFTR